MRVAVAGGTGVVGRYVVELLRERGQEPVVLARSRAVDLLTGDGLEQAMTGVAAVVDVSNVTTTSRRRSVDFFTRSTGRLLDAGRRVGAHHHVALSIVGADRVELGYHAGKRAQEQLVLAGPVPGTVLRATQFHEFPGQLLDRVPGPLAVVPRMLVQPVAAREVARALVDLASGPPVGMAPELAGPQELELVQLARRVQQARRSRRFVLGVVLPGRGGRAVASGALLPTGPGPRGQQTFDQWLTDRRRPVGGGHGGGSRP